jgi:hypothetical protein
MSHQYQSSTFVRLYGRCRCPASGLPAIKKNRGKVTWLRSATMSASRSIETFVRFIFFRRLNLDSFFSFSVGTTGDAQAFLICDGCFAFKESPPPRHSAISFAKNGTKCVLIAFSISTRLEDGVVCTSRRSDS